MSYRGFFVRCTTKRIYLRFERIRKFEYQFKHTNQQTMFRESSNSRKLNDHAIDAFEAKSVTMVLNLFSRKVQSRQYAFFFFTKLSNKKCRKQRLRQQA